MLEAEARTCSIRVSNVVVVNVDVDIEAYCLSPQNHDTIRYGII